MRKEIIQKIRNRIQKLKVHYLTLDQKIYIINTLIFPIIAYYIPYINVTKSFVNAYYSMIRKFLWNESIPTISINKLTLSKGNNGLGLININEYEMVRNYNIWIKMMNEKEIIPTDTPPPNTIIQKIYNTYKKTEEELHFNTNTKIAIKEIQKKKSDKRIILLSDDNIKIKKVIKMLTKSQLHAKYKNFLLKIIYNCIPVKTFLYYKRGLTKIDINCSMCQRDDETMDHFLNTCTYFSTYDEQAKQIMQHKTQRINYIEKIRESITTKNIKLLRKIMIIIYTKWLVRNYSVFKRIKINQTNYLTRTINKIMEEDKMVIEREEFETLW